MQMEEEVLLTPSLLKFGSTTLTHSKAIGCYVTISFEKCIVLYGSFFSATVVEENSAPLASALLRLEMTVPA
jgi:hypothetical protein